MRSVSKTLLLILAVTMVLSASGVYASWVYTGDSVAGTNGNLSVNLATFIDLPEQGIDIMNQFSDILNNRVPCNVTINGVQYTQSYDALITAFNSSPKPSGWFATTLHNNSYIGTMQTSGDDVNAVRTLFGDSLTAEEESSEDYALMLKREPLDGNDHTGMSYYRDGDHWWPDENQYYPGSEMVLYSTNWQTDENTPDNYVIVYVTVFTRYPKTDENGNYLYDLDENGNIQYYTYTNRNNQTVTTNYPIYQYEDWEKISGENGYIGYAQIRSYSSGDQTRSFNTGTWISAAAYGTSSAGATLSEIIQALVNSN